MSITLYDELCKLGSGRVQRESEWQHALFTEAFSFIDYFSSKINAPQIWHDLSNKRNVRYMKLIDITENVPLEFNGISNLKPITDDGIFYFGIRTTFDGPGKNNLPKIDLTIPISIKLTHDGFEYVLWDANEMRPIKGLSWVNDKDCFIENITESLVKHFSFDPFSPSDWVSKPSYFGFIP